MTADEQFVAAAIRRLYWWMAAFSAAATAALLLWKGWWYAAGFAVGASLSILNFHWLKSGVDGLVAFSRPAAQTEQETEHARQRGRGLVARWVLRYALIVAVGYVIFQSSAVSMTAFLGGLFIFVAGVLAEMIYELAAGTGA